MSLLRTRWWILSAIEGTWTAHSATTLVRHSIRETIRTTQRYRWTRTAANLELVATISTVTLTLSLSGATALSSSQRAGGLRKAEWDVISRRDLAWWPFTGGLLS
jgi:hypothetical protein